MSVKTISTAAAMLLALSVGTAAFAQSGTTKAPADAPYAVGGGSANKQDTSSYAVGGGSANKSATYPVGGGSSTKSGQYKQGSVQSLTPSSALDGDKPNNK
jgi:hypothetical protein